MCTTSYSSLQGSFSVGRDDRRLQSICAFRHLRSQLALGGRALCISELAQNSSEGGVGAGKIGLKADGLAKSIGSFLKFPLLFKNGAQSVVNFGIIGPSLDGSPRFFGGAAQPSLLPEDDTERVMHVRLRRMKRGRLL